MSRTFPGFRPQFSVKAIFGVTTWTAALAGIAVSDFRCWTMFAVGLSLACLNCSGKLSACQQPSAQMRCFQASWLLLILSLFLPAMKGCNNTPIVGWQAAEVCALTVLDPPAETFHQPAPYLLICLGTAANVLLVLSPLFLWRLRHGNCVCFGLLLAAAAPAMWCFGDPAQVLIGYYVWCTGGLLIMCAFPMRWVVLPLLAIAPMLASFTHRGRDSTPTTLSALSDRSTSGRGCVVE